MGTDVLTQMDLHSFLMSMDWTDADANLHVVADTETLHRCRELHVCDECLL